MSVGDSVYHSGSQVGTVYSVQCTNYQTGDWAFVQKSNSNFDLTRKIQSGSGATVNISGTQSDPSVGTVVFRYGATTGYAFGEVTYRNITQQVSNIYIDGLTEVRKDYGFIADGGDSGCPYYIYVSNANLFVGILCGSSYSMGFEYFTPYRVFNNVFSAKIS